MRCIQKLVRNGNATHVALPRPLLMWLNWLPGEAIVVEALEDKSVRLRRPTSDDFLPRNPKPLKLDTSFPSTS